MQVAILGPARARESLHSTSRVSWWKVYLAAFLDFPVIHVGRQGGGPFVLLHSTDCPRHIEHRPRHLNNLKPRPLPTSFACRRLERRPNSRIALSQERLSLSGSVCNVGICTFWWRRVALWNSVVCLPTTVRSYLASCSFAPHTQQHPPSQLTMSQVAA